MYRDVDIFSNVKDGEYLNNSEAMLKIQEQVYAIISEMNIY